MTVPDDAKSNWISSAVGTARTVKGTAKSTLVGTLQIMKNKVMNSNSKRKTSTAHLPLATATKILDHILNLIPAFHKMYARYDEVDAAM